MMNQTDQKNTFQAMNVNASYTLTFVFLLIEMIGILGNSLVILSVEFDARMRRSLTNQLIVRVASCDLLILLFNIPDLIQFVSSNNGDWILQEMLCKFIRTTLVVAQYASVLTMCALTVERFIGIVYPLRSKLLRERQHVILITLLVWLFSFLCASPNLIYLRVLAEPFSSRRSCRLLYSKNNPQKNQQSYIIHKVMESLVFYFIPLLLQIYCYSRIARRLFYVDENLQTSFRVTVKSTAKNTIDNEDDYIDNEDNLSTKYTRADSFSHQSQNFLQATTSSYSPRVVRHRCSIVRTSEPRRSTTVTYNALKSRRSVIKMLCIVVFIYFLSFSPQVFVFLLFETNVIRVVPQFIQTPYFGAFTMLLVTISSASNPIVYAIFCSKFRQSFAKVLRKLFCCCCCSHRKEKFNYSSDQRAVSLQQLSRLNRARLSEKYLTNDKILVHANGKYPSSS